LYANKKAHTNKYLCVLSIQVDSEGLGPATP